MSALPPPRWGLGAVGAGLLAWLLGTAVQLQQASLWPGALYAGLLLAALLIGGALLPWVVRPAGRVTRRWLTAGGCVTLALAAFATTGWRAHWRLADALPPALEGRDLQLVGTVASMPQASSQGMRFVFAVESASLGVEPVRVPQRVSMGWFAGFDGEALLEGPQWDLQVGQRWQFTARLRRPHGPANPHGFDLELWLWEQGLRATGSVRVTASAPLQRLTDAPAWAHPFERLRQALRDRIRSGLPEQPRAAGVIAALAVGDQGAIERADWALFRDSGVAHLMSISGLHVTMFAWLAAAVVGMLWRRSTRLLLWQPAARAALWGGVLLAGLYALVAGFEVPAQRTWWMLLSLACLRSLGLRWPPPWLLLAAGAVVAAWDPWALLQPGFWLSFCAVGLLMLTGRDLVPQGFGAHLRSGLRSQAVATVGLAPLSLLFFHQLSWLGFVANLVSIPLVTFVVTPLALLGALVPGLWALAAWAMQGLMAWLGWLVQWQAAVWVAAAAPAWAVLGGFVGAVLLVLPLPWRWRLWGLPLLLPMLSPPVARPAPGQFEAVFADVGQGTAALVRTAQHLLVYDTGPQTSPGHDAGERVLLPLLRARGERRIDLLLLSHADTDHIGGALSLLSGMPVARSLGSLPAGHALRGRLPGFEPCVAGQRWLWDGVQFEVLHPFEPEANPGAKPNSVSCVLRIESADGQRSLLLTGDIEAAQEAALLQRHGAALRSEGLMLPHHGSKTSSSAAFIAAVQPRWAVAQAGYLSRFGHPAPEVLARYAQAAVPVWTSPRCGALQVNPQGLLSCERGLRRRYWHHVDGGSAPVDGRQ
jgi:competence protein ComEC